MHYTTSITAATTKRLRIPELTIYSSVPNKPALCLFISGNFLRAFKYVGMKMHCSD